MTAERSPRAICGICGEKTNRATSMCDPCATAYDRQAHDDGSVIFALLWAARRARWYAERRARRRRAR